MPDALTSAYLPRLDDAPAPPSWACWACRASIWRCRSRSCWRTSFCWSARAVASWRDCCWRAATCSFLLHAQRLSACSVLSWALRLASSFVVGVLRLQADALDIDLGQFHRLAGEGAVGGLGLLVRLGLDHAPEILLLEQGHVIGQVVRLEQQAGAIRAVVGRAQFRDLAVLDQALQLGDGAGRTRGGRGRRRHRRGRRLRLQPAGPRAGRLRVAGRWRKPPDRTGPYPTAPCARWHG